MAVKRNWNIRAALLALFALPALLSGCGGEPEQTSQTGADGYPPQNITRKFVEPRYEKAYSYIDWVRPELSEIAGECSAVVRGVAGASREAAVSYYYQGDSHTDYYTVIEFETVQVLRLAEGESAPGKIKLLYILSSYFTEPGAVEFEEGAEYILFLRRLAGWESNDTGLEELADYNIVFPRYLIIPENGGGYDSSELMPIVNNKANEDNEQYKKEPLVNVESVIKTIFEQGE